MQTCKFNYNNIINRHNCVNNMLMTILNKHKYRTITEPNIRTPEGLRKPDLLAYRNDTVYIIDTQISHDNTNTDNNYKTKTDYYIKTEILDYAKQLTDVKQAKVSALCWNWQGTPSSQTTKDLIELGLSKRDISLLNIRVITGSLNTYRKYCYLGLS